MAALDSEVSLSARAIYQILLAFAHGEDHVLIGQKKLAHHAGLEQRQVRRYLAELEAARWIDSKQIGKNQHNQYKLNLVVKFNEKCGVICDRRTEVI
jgi:hypothetical protein